MLKFRIAFYLAAIVFAVLVNSNIDPKAAAAASGQLTNAELGLTVLN